MGIQPVSDVAVAAAVPAYSPALMAAPAATSAEPAMAPSQFFTSPVVSLTDTGLAVLQFRDSVTGEVTAQVPPERATEQYRLRGGERGAPVFESPAAASGGDDGGGTSSAQVGNTADGAAENGGAGTGQKVAVNA